MSRRWSIGSRWLRWDPHLHALGTLRNNQFGGDWEGYLRALESASPRPVALGITDYFSLNTYKRVLEWRAGGRLRDIPLVYANVELRLTVETRRGNAVNLHMLISPDDPEHVERADALLSGLSWSFRERTYQCTETDLKRLGRAFRDDPRLPDDAAMSEGANQFKVLWGKLQELRNTDSWVRDNVLFAVAAGEDGLSGLARDGAFAGERENLGRFADLGFSSNPGDRQYWSGEHDGFATARHRAKPCLHGSDAHALCSPG